MADTLAITVQPWLSAARSVIADAWAPADAQSTCGTVADDSKALGVADSASTHSCESPAAGSGPALSSQLTTILQQAQRCADAEPTMQEVIAQVDRVELPTSDTRLLGVVDFELPRALHLYQPAIRTGQAPRYRLCASTNPAVLDSSDTTGSTQADPVAVAALRSNGDQVKRGVAAQAMIDEAFFKHVLKVLILQRTRPADAE